MIFGHDPERAEKALQSYLDRFTAYLSALPTDRREDEAKRVMARLMVGLMVKANWRSRWAHHIECADCSPLLRIAPRQQSTPVHFAPSTETRQ